MSNYTELKFNINAKELLLDKKKHIPNIVISDYPEFFNQYFNIYLDHFLPKNLYYLPDNSKYILEVYNEENFPNNFNFSFKDVYIWLSQKNIHTIFLKHKFISSIEMIPNFNSFNENIIIYAHIKNKKRCWCF